ncbi:hypothetical protein LCGC14_1515320 [marine sediment metagenome]|uniref:Uncharacterized protein n=1 Tax=marine sediment metagenome TaxID=412755 RepID=A0A0F9JKY3_9ZZZZ
MRACPKCKSGNIYPIAQEYGVAGTGGTGCRQCGSFYDLGEQEFHVERDGDTEKRVPGPKPLPAKPEPVVELPPPVKPTDPVTKPRPA